MPGLIRGIARTAAVAGTATAVGGRVRRRQDAKFAQKDAQNAGYDEPAEQQQQYAPPQQQYAPPPAPPQQAAPSTGDKLEQLKTLGELKAQGVLTEEEFAAQKAKILAS